MKGEGDYPIYRIVNDKLVGLSGIDPKIVKEESDKDYKKAFKVYPYGPLGAPNVEVVECIVEEGEYSCYGVDVITNLNNDPKTGELFWVVKFSITIRKKLD
jgi:hypothetical protein